MDNNLLHRIVDAMQKAEGPDGPDKQNARVLFHTLMWEHRDDILEIIDQHMLEQDDEDDEDDDLTEEEKGGEDE